MSLLVTSQTIVATTTGSTCAGFSFLVGATPITISTLARWVYAGNSQPHAVKLWSFSGVHATAATLLGSATIVTSGQTAGQYSPYVALSSPITLSANSYYIIAADESADAFGSAGNGLDVTTDAAIGTIKSAQVIGGTAYLDQSNRSFGPVNAMFAPATVSISPTDVLFSPGNWSGDSSGRGGATYNQTCYPGAWIKPKPFTTTATSPSITLKLSNPTAGSQIFYRINRGAEVVANVPSDTTGITIALPGPGTYAIEIYIEKLAQTGRWSLANAIKFSGVTLDSTATTGVLPTLRPWVRLIGDSTKEGVLSDNFTTSLLTSSSYAIMKMLNAIGYDLGLGAHGGSGYLVYGGSDSSIPPYNRYVDGDQYFNDSRIDKISDGVSLYDTNNHVSADGIVGKEPVLLINNLLINDAQNGASQSDLSLSIADSIARDRAAAPSAWLIYLVPACLYNTALSANGPLYVNLLKSAVLNYQTAHPGDTKVMLYDRGAFVGNLITSIHRDAAGYALDAQQEGPACFVTTWDNANNFAPTLASIKIKTDTLPNRQQIGLS